MEKHSAYKLSVSLRKCQQQNQIKLSKWPLQLSIRQEILSVYLVEILRPLVDKNNIEDSCSEAAMLSIFSVGKQLSALEIITIC